MVNKSSTVFTKLVGGHEKILYILVQGGRVSIIAELGEKESFIANGVFG